ncbi:MAG: sulfide/dihydroorotate dehydrogenase-like FAD/NAD-binding protein [Bacillota bacterium]
MFEILSKKELAPSIIEYEIFAPNVARHAKAGQFIILIVDELGERIPFTIAKYDREKHSITISVQTVGYSTQKLAMLKQGDCLHDFVGPLGNPTELDEYKKIMLVAGGIGSAVISPQAIELKEKGKDFDAIIGARNEELLLYRDVFDKTATGVFYMTDDGSFGEKGFVTQKLEEKLAGGGYDLVFAVGPLRMMQAVCGVAKKYNVKSIVSMNSLMVDGTGMCGGCRVTVGGKTKYACVDGPEFDGDEIDFEEALSRSQTYASQEQEHKCRLR